MTAPGNPPETADTAALFETMLDHLPVLVFVKDARPECFGRFVFWNKTCEALIGIPKAQVLGKTVFDLHPREQAAFFEQKDREVVARGALVDIPEEPLDCPALGPRLLHTQKTPLFDEQGQPRFILCVAEDITDRKRAEAALAAVRDQLEQRVEERTAELTTTNEALRESEEKYRSLVEASPLAVFMADLEGHVIFASPRAGELYGALAEDLVGQDPLRFFVPEDHQRMLANLARTVAEGPTRNIEYTLVRKDGTRFPGEVSAAVIRDRRGNPKHLVAIVRDTSERKRAEEQLRQGRDELQAIYDGIVEGIIVADAESATLLRANDAYCRLVGWFGEAIYGLSPDKVHPPETLPKVWEHLAAVKRGTAARIDDLPFLRRDGSLVYADVVSVPISYNRRPAWISFFHDVTERKRAHDALQSAHRTLKHMLQASDHERQVIAYEIHDGLAQQLAGAIMQLQTYEHWKDADPARAGKAYAAGLTMLQQGHFEARRLIAGVRPPILDESGVVAAVGHLVNEHSRVRGPSIEYRSQVAFDRLMPTLENAIYRIVQEGLANACQHSQSKKARVSIVQREDRVEIEVRDWGVGFDVRARQGNRYGLEGIRQRARLLDGKCRIRSKPGKGTRVWVELPVVEREE